MKVDLTKMTYVFFGACAVAGLTYLGVIKYYEKELEFCKDYPQLLEVNDKVKNNYYKEIDSESLQYDMIEGLINGLDDRFSFYNSKKKENENYVNDSNMLKSNGFQVGQDSESKRMVITEVVHDSAVEKQGMSAGDFIIAIDDTVVQQNGYYNSIDLLLGKKDTPLRLVCSHEGNFYEVELKKGQKLKDDSPFMDNQMLDNGIYYYHLSSFSSGADAVFQHELNEYRDDVKGLIFDLRDNSGGEAKSTMQLFDCFYGSGAKVKAVFEKTGEESVYETSNGVEYDFPVVLLVSYDSYSAAEMLAALFQDTGRGTVIGTQTGGKGVLQIAPTLEDWSTYYLVAGYYYVNDLPNYDGVGITPDIIVDMDPELIGTDEDIQLKKAIELLS